VALLACEPGATTREVADRAEQLILARKATPILRGYAHADAPVGAQGTRDFPAAACTCVNEEVVHAVPSMRILRPGDVATIDVALEYAGWCVDSAWSVVVGGLAHPNSARALALVRASQAVLAHSLALARPGVRWSTIAESGARVARDMGCTLVQGYCGHGIGRSLHESPRLAFTSTDWARPGEDFVLRPGMVLCVEPILVEGVAPASLTLLDDGWTVLTDDARWTAHEERCVAITRTGVRVIAGAEEP
jgi:methionyl aminopeptidase